MIIEDKTEESHTEHTEFTEEDRRGEYEILARNG